MMDLSDLTPFEPKTVIEAADCTADPDVIEPFWEITQHRLNEENERQGAARDRAGKYISYGFSILASVGGVLVLARDLIKDAFLLDQSWAYFLIGLIAALLVSAFTSVAMTLHHATQALLSTEYRTWNDSDLKMVQLGGKDQNYAYKRYLIKAAWNLIAHNGPINDRKTGEADSSLNSFKAGALAAIILVVLVVFTNALVGRALSKNPKAREVSGVAGANIMSETQLLEKVKANPKGLSSSASSSLSPPNPVVIPRGVHNYAK